VVTEATEEVAMAAAAVATEEVGEFPVGLAEGAILVRCLLEAGKCSLAAEWAYGVATTGTAARGAANAGAANAGVAETGAVIIGMAAIGTTGMAETGAVAIGMAELGVVEIGTEV
jgi:hypothetical protein